VKSMRISFKFVEAIPEKLEEHRLYITIDYATIAHKCCCGCGQEVVTPLSPTDWKLTYDGVSVSLSPSIGNWSLKCQSHYWIVKNEVRWAYQWSPEEIEAGRAADKRAKKAYYEAGSELNTRSTSHRAHGFWSRLACWLRNS